MLNPKLSTKNSQSNFFQLLKSGKIAVKSLIFTFTVLIILLLGQLPGQATTLDQQIKKTINSFVSQITTIKNLLLDMFNLSSDSDSSNSDNTSEYNPNTSLENKPSSSYEIEQDNQERQRILSARENAHDATLGSEAQQQLQETSTAIDNNLTANQQLADESQSLDVSQHILQNISQQLALLGEQQALNLQQHQQAQVDQAISNLVTAQTAEELAEENTASRRKDSGIANTATFQWGLIMMPGLNTNNSQNNH